MSDPSSTLGLWCVYKTVQVVDHAATGLRARKHRKSQGVTLRAVARHMNISAPYLSDLELGRRNWTLDLSLKFNRSVAMAFINRIQRAQKNTHKSVLKLD